MTFEPVTAGGGATEFNVTPKPGKKGKIKVTVTMTPPDAGAPSVSVMTLEQVAERRKADPPAYAPPA